MIGADPSEADEFFRDTVGVTPEQQQVSNKQRPIRCKEIEDAIIAVHKIFQEQAGTPEDIWHPDFGWVLRNGKPTETTEAFLKMIEEHNGRCEGTASCKE